MLKAVPKSWFSWDFTIFDEMTPVAKIDLAWAREAGELNIGDTTYKMYREGLFNGAFILQTGEGVLARAEKPSALRRAFKVEYNNRHYVLEAASAFGRKFVLREGKRIVGSVYPERWFTRKAIIDLPPSLAFPVKIFLTWLTIILWKRAASAAASG